MKARHQYGKTRHGVAIAAPPGWELVRHGDWIPQAHRECLSSPDRDLFWCQPRRCHSTMTAIWARVWGHVHAYARPQGTYETPPPGMECAPPGHDGEAFDDSDDGLRSTT